jgi:hypothetical protein
MRRAVVLLLFVLFATLIAAAGCERVLGCREGVAQCLGGHRARVCRAKTWVPMRCRDDCTHAMTECGTVDDPVPGEACWSETQSRRTPDDWTACSADRRAVVWCTQSTVWTQVRACGADEQCVGGIEEGGTMHVRCAKLAPD